MAGRIMLRGLRDAKPDFDLARHLRAFPRRACLGGAAIRSQSATGAGAVPLAVWDRARRWPELRRPSRSAAAVHERSGASNAMFLTPTLQTQPWHRGTSSRTT